MRARFVRIAKLIMTVGLQRVGKPHVKHLTGPFVGDAPQWQGRKPGPAEETGLSRGPVHEAQSRDPEGAGPGLP